MPSLNELLHEIRRIEQNREVLTNRKIKAMYSTLVDDLDTFLAKGYKKYADSEGRLYIANLDAHNQRARFLQEIVNNVDNLTPQMQQTVSKLIDDVYSTSYSGMVTALKKADTAKKFEEITKDLAVNPDVLNQAINNNISKLTLPTVMEKHRSEIIYQLQQALNIGLMQGDRYETMAKRVTEVLRGNGLTKGLQGKSMNIVRTEIHRNTESGFMDCAENIQEGMQGSPYIYAATWRNMGDERVRPKQRRRTKNGWKTTLNKNGANHIKMDGQTVKAGDMFDLGNGVKAKAPSQSGVAGHDCNCRCFLEYNLMTAEEFAKATGQKIKQTKKTEKVELQLSDYPEMFTKGAEGKNTQKLIDYINGLEGADTNALKLYSSIGKLENIDSNGIPFKISHAKGNAITVTSRRGSGEIVDVKFTIPKLKGDNLAGQVNTTLHETMHLLDMFGREDIKTSSKWFSLQDKELSKVFKNTSADMGDEIAELFKKHNAEYAIVRKTAQKNYDDAARAVKEKYLPNGMSPWENMKGYRQYEKEAKKLLKQMTEEIDYNARNIMGGGICNLQDIYDALSSGTYRANGTVIYGHGQQYYAYESAKIKETVANYVSLSVTRPDLIDMLRKDKPQLCEALDNMVTSYLAKVGS